MLKASNLTELGMINIHQINAEMEISSAELFVDLIKCNPRIKSLHIPAVASELFLADALEHPEVEYHFEELHFNLHSPCRPRRVNYFETVMNFLETQRDSLKYAQLENCVIEEESTTRLLSLNLVSLELIRCYIGLSPSAGFRNSSIESLAFICVSSLDPDFVYYFMKECRNLSAFVAFTKQPPLNNFPETINSWKLIDTKKYTPKYFHLQTFAACATVGWRLL